MYGASGLVGDRRVLGGLTVADPLFTLLLEVLALNADALGAEIEVELTLGGLFVGLGAHVHDHVGGPHLVRISKGGPAASLFGAYIFEFAAHLGRVGGLAALLDRRESLGPPLVVLSLGDMYFGRVNLAAVDLRGRQGTISRLNVLSLVEGRLGEGGSTLLHGFRDGFQLGRGGHLR